MEREPKDCELHPQHYNQRKRQQPLRQRQAVPPECRVLRPLTGGGALGIPAALLGVAGAAVGAFAGYSVGDVIHNLLAHVPSFLSFISVGSLLVVGTALIIDGCRRILGSETFQK